MRIDECVVCWVGGVAVRCADGQTDRNELQSTLTGVVASAFLSGAAFAAARPLLTMGRELAETTLLCPLHRQLISALWIAGPA